jgi:predicted amidohydrolase YtcJ
MQVAHAGHEADPTDGLVLSGGVIVTMEDPELGSVEALGITGGRIVAAGARGDGRERARSLGASRRSRRPDPCSRA